VTQPRDDVVDVLLAQHARIEDLFHQVLTGRGDSRRVAFDRLVRLLAVHETAEEEIVHPTARVSMPDGPGVVDDRLAEEREAKEVLAQLQELDPDDPRFEPVFGELRMAVLQHAKREERYEFPRLRHHLTPERLRTMAAALLAAEALAPTRPHPGVESAAANAALGPSLALVDQVRDTVRDAMRG
jgi:hemerythrin superfamily protein